MKINLSIVIPVHNEEQILEKNIILFIDYFNKYKSINLFEIIIVENGSIDHTSFIAKKLAKNYHNVSFYSINERGLGLALKKGIGNAKYPFIYVNAIDNPFKFEDVIQFLNSKDSCDLVFASKNHPRSLYKDSIIRVIPSKIITFFIKTIFSLPLTDTQGTFFGKKETLMKILPNCTSSGAFFQAQIAINAARAGMKISEVPVHYISQGKKSKFHLTKDGLLFLFELIKEKAKSFQLDARPRLSRSRGKQTRR
ncbi:hypothetical protein A2Y99_05085 [Candidatus Gottesmanbacteria bacterium RBG_13_37_7]|uniref:Glycosyltransferase 2-like domain-containing protein n=1 Tax=Candidatus Gottesmanbacteria bacterium RBG_13_37_7 TaxID=1798369 RepID=A0A1F5YJQ8_9BACT|nr:MAG: hypothetical protein A2Y99_05085 [Candidatus Gottesmanbacteria bacterium RBG_13_37_7]